jgi:O-antigen ligase
MALNFTGGREISAESGADRTAIWSQGLQLLKAHPLFGVGIGRMADYTDVHLTAHNTLIVCAVELGLVGLYFWCLFLYPTMRNAMDVASKRQANEGDKSIFKEDLTPEPAICLESSSTSEVSHLGRLVVLSFTGFLVTGWFLSRSFVLTFFLLGGIAEVVFQLALERGMVDSRMPLARVLRNSGVLMIVLLLAMYVLLRLVHLMH